MVGTRISSDPRPDLARRCAPIGKSNVARHESSQHVADRRRRRPVGAADRDAGAAAVGVGDRSPRQRRAAPPRRGSRSRRRRRASWAGQRRGSRSGAEDVAEDRRLRRRRWRRRGPAGRPRRSPGSASRARRAARCGSAPGSPAPASVESSAARAREDRQHVAVRPDPEQEQVEDRPAADARRARPARSSSASVAAHQAAPRAAPIASPVGNGWSCSTGIGTPGPAAGRALLAVGDPQQDVVERLDVRERVVARARSGRRPTRRGRRPTGRESRSGGVREAPVDRRPATSRRSSPSPRGPAPRRPPRERVGDAVRRRGRARRPRSATTTTLARAASSARPSASARRGRPRTAARRRRPGRDRPASIASASRSTSVRRGARNMPVERLHAVLPDADVDGLGLGGDVGPQLGAAPLGEQLDPQRRPGRHRRDDRPDRRRRPRRGRRTGWPRSPRPTTGLASGPRDAARRRAGRSVPGDRGQRLARRDRPSREASQPTW